MLAELVRHTREALVNSLPERLAYLLVDAVDGVFQLVQEAVLSPPEVRYPTFQALLALVILTPLRVPIQLSQALRNQVPPVRAKDLVCEELMDRVF